MSASRPSSAGARRSPWMPPMSNGTSPTSPATPISASTSSSLARRRSSPIFRQASVNRIGFAPLKQHMLPEDQMSFKYKLIAAAASAALAAPAFAQEVNADAAAKADTPAAEAG